jgi:hypothetical protein
VQVSIQISDNAMFYANNFIIIDIVISICIHLEDNYCKNVSLLDLSVLTMG